MGGDGGDGLDDFLFEVAKRPSPVMKGVVAVAALEGLEPNPEASGFYSAVFSCVRSPGQEDGFQDAGYEGVGLGSVGAEFLGDDFLGDWYFKVRQMCFLCAGAKY
jgi:hypothetical protein